MLTRRAALLAPLPLFGCRPVKPLDVQWLGPDPARAHKLREPVPGGEAKQRKVDVLVLGAGIAGLTCARQLQRSGRGVALLELDDAPGGNSRAGRVGGLPCPLGAHYLPQPDASLPELQDLLVELGAAERRSGRWQAKAQHEVHAPAERRFDGQRWQPGLLPPPETDADRRQHLRFAAAVRAAKALGFGLPTHRAAWTDAHRQLDAQRFDQWLAQQGLSEPGLLWYLDYCCRDDYGAGSSTVSAWAGLQYFASRHGFHADGDQDDPHEPAPPQLTWPEGNGWLAERMATGLELHTGRVALQLDEEREGVRLRCWTPEGLEDWRAAQIVLAVPFFVAQRIWRNASPALQAVRLQRAPWLVANLQLDAPLLARVGAPAAWDNVIQASPTLGYVNAQHQNLDPRPGAKVLTLYWALASAERQQLLNASSQDWATRVLEALRPTHPDIDERLQAMRLTRWGHAMAVPTPGARGQAALAALRNTRGRVRFAHADLAAYSVFEEAFSAGLEAANALAR
jgi:phytoene dehydrogenase-like protein